MKNIDDVTMRAIVQVVEASLKDVINWDDWKLKTHTARRYIEYCTGHLARKAERILRSLDDDGENIYTQGGARIEEAITREQARIHNHVIELKIMFGF